MAAADAPALPAVTDGALTPPTLNQVLLLAGYQLRDYIRSRRFVILYGIVAAIGVIFTVLVAHYRPAGIIGSPTGFWTSSWGGGAGYVVILATIFFGGDAIAGEFQNKTGYFLMGLPIRRSAVYSGKFIAAFLASLGAVALDLVISLANGVYYLGGSAFEWQLGASFLLTIGYLLAVLGMTFFFSSLFKTSAYGILLTAILFLFGFTILQDVIVALVNIEPWFIISYAQPVIGNIFQTPFPPHAPGVYNGVPNPFWNATIPEGIGIMLGYFALTSVAGLLLFEHEEFS